MTAPETSAGAPSDDQERAEQQAATPVPANASPGDLRSHRAARNEEYKELARSVKTSPMPMLREPSPDQPEMLSGAGVGGGGMANGSLQGLGIAHGRGSGSAGYGSAASGTQRGGDGAAVATDTEQYTGYGTNEMTATSKDALSTFSIDVDTASYTLARRKLTEGSLPPADAVRVEEFVNFFPYHYAQPTDGAPFAVDMEGAPSPWDATHTLLRVGIQGRSVAPKDAKPRRLTFLVDVSGSMESEDKIGLVKRSLRFLVDQLGPEDSVALVTYAGNTRVVLEPTPCTKRGVIDSAIEDLNAGGSTAMASGIELAYKQAMGAYVPGAENRVLVLSDGDANVGATSHEEILNTIAGYAKKGITLSTLGFGEGNYKDTMMEQLADKGDGNYTYVDGFSEAKRVFGTQLAGTMEVIARDVKIQVDFDPNAVMAYRLIGYENRDIADKDFRNDKVDAGEIGSGHTVTALYDVVLRDRALANKDNPLATVRLRAKKPGPDSASKEWATSMTARQVHSELADTSPDFRIAVGAASFAEVLRGSKYANELTYAQIWSLVDGAARKGVPDDRELMDLIARAGQLAGQRGPWGSRNVALEE